MWYIQLLLPLVGNFECMLWCLHWCALSQMNLFFLFAGKRTFLIRVKEAIRSLIGIIDYTIFFCICYWHLRVRTLRFRSIMNWRRNLHIHSFIVLYPLLLDPANPAIKQVKGGPLIRDRCTFLLVLLDPTSPSFLECSFEILPIYPYLQCIDVSLNLSVRKDILGRFTHLYEFSDTRLQWSILKHRFIFAFVSLLLLAIFILFPMENLG